MARFCPFLAHWPLRVCTRLKVGDQFCHCRFKVLLLLGAETRGRAFGEGSSQPEPFVPRSGRRERPGTALRPYQETST
jgi:hypothetical protein